MEAVLTDTKFLPLSTLIELIQALSIRIDRFKSGSLEHRCVFHFELLTRVLMKNRDRVRQTWFYFHSLVQSLFSSEQVDQSFDFMFERFAIGTLRLCVEILRRNDCTEEVVQTLGLFKSFGQVFEFIRRDVCDAICETVKITVLKCKVEWEIVFGLIERFSLSSNTLKDNSDYDLLEKSCELLMTVVSGNRVSDDNFTHCFDLTQRVMDVCIEAHESVHHVNLPDDLFIICDHRRPIRAEALNLFQKDIAQSEVRDFFDKTGWNIMFTESLFPLLDRLSKIINSHNLVFEEISIRICQLACRLFLQHLVNLGSTNEFLKLWLHLLSSIRNLLVAGNTSLEMLRESAYESLKNVMLVMHTAGLFNRENDKKLFEMTKDYVVRELGSSLWSDLSEVCGFNEMDGDETEEISGIIVDAKKEIDDH
ncbi:hypothetical protein ACOME3_002948 [Neoechinorhynchus agilis]